VSLSASDVGAVSSSTTVNGHTLTGPVSLSATDVQAVPLSRTVNGKALSADVVLSATDVGAVALTNGDIMPTVPGVSNIGSPTSKFKGIYTKELFLDANTLYVNGVPVLSSSANTMNFQADANQGIAIRTTGSGQTILDSQSSTIIQTNGINADVQVQTQGTGARVRMTSNTEVTVNAPQFTVDGTTTLSGNLTVTGSITQNGQNFIVNATNMAIQDNIVVLNRGQTGTSVSLRYSGVAIDRGDGAQARIVWDETKQAFITGLVGSEVQVATLDASGKLPLGSLSLTASDVGAYSTSQVDAIAATKVDKTLTVSGKALSGNITLSSSDVGAYSTSQVDTALVAKADKATTLAGYGITDAYTQTQVDSRIQAVVGAAPAALDTLQEIAAQLATDESAVSALTTVVSGKADKATTLAGYGITDAVPSVRTVNGKALSANVTLSAADVGLTAVSQLTNDTGYQSAAQVTALIGSTKPSLANVTWADL